MDEYLPMQILDYRSRGRYRNRYRILQRLLSSNSVVFFKKLDSDTDSDPDPDPDVRSAG